MERKTDEWKREKKKQRTALCLYFTVAVAVHLFPQGINLGRVFQDAANLFLSINKLWRGGQRLEWLLHVFNLGSRWRRRVGRLVLLRDPIWLVVERE